MLDFYVLWNIIDTWKIAIAVIAGESMGKTSSVRTRTPTHYLDFYVGPGGNFRQPTQRGWTVFAYILAGDIEFGNFKRWIFLTISFLKWGLSFIIKLLFKKEMERPLQPTTQQSLVMENTSSFITKVRNRKRTLCCLLDSPLVNLSFSRDLSLWIRGKKSIKLSKITIHTRMALKKLANGNLNSEMFKTVSFPNIYLLLSRIS